MPLVHFESWKKNKKFSPNALLLDPDNYRLSRTGDRLSERQIIHQLVVNEGVRDLAAQIVQKGYMPVEDIIVVKENGRNVVAEGNRRVCAVKLLKNPDLAPDDFKKSFENLKKRAGNELPKQLYCVIAPNRAEANIYVFSKHAEESFSRRWQSIRQASFVVDQLNKGLSIDEVTEATGLARSKIIEEVVALDLYRISALLPLSQKAKSVVTSATLFPYTALVERIFGNEDIRNLLGVELTENGIIGVAGNREGFLDALAAIFEDVSAGNGDEAATRKYGTKTKAFSRLKEITKYRAKGRSNWKAFRPEDVVFVDGSDDDGPSSGGKGKGKGKRGKRDRKSIDYLLPNDLVVEVGGAKLRDLINEAQRIDTGTHPHSAAVFLRCIFEIALNTAVDERKCRKKLLAKHTPSQGTEISIRVLLEEAKRGVEFNLGLDLQETRGVSHLIKDGPLSYDLFNLYVHNIHWPATSESLRALREVLLPILRKSLLRP